MGVLKVIGERHRTSVLVIIRQENIRTRELGVYLRQKNIRTRDRVCIFKTKEQKNKRVGCRQLGYMRT